MNLENYIDKELNQLTNAELKFLIKEATDSDFLPDDSPLRYMVSRMYGNYTIGNMLLFVTCSLLIELNNRINE